MNVTAGRAVILAVSVLAVMIIALLVTGCAYIDSVDSRADSMNESVTRFRNQVALHNLIRASRNEPLNFAAVSGITGHNTAQAGLPGSLGVVWALHNAVKETLSPTTSFYAVSNDFNYYEIDDPESIQALLTPLDATTIAAFFSSSNIYDADFLLLLFIYRIRIADTSGQILDEVYSNCIKPNIPDCSSQMYTRELFTYLAAQGLTFRVERASIPGQAGKTRTQICFDPDREKRANKTRFVRRYGPVNLKKLIEEQPPFRFQRQMKVQPSTAASYCDKPDTWLPAPSSDATGTIKITCDKSKCGAKMPSLSSKPQAAYYVYDAQDKVWLELIPRSTYQIYKFLGDLMPPTEKIPLVLGEHPPNFLLNVVLGSSDKCFTSVFDTAFYCVPEENSDNTKAIFTILHQLAGLYTKAGNPTPVTSTVRITP